MKRWLRVALTLIVSSLAVAYILHKIDLHKTFDILGNASVPWVLLSVFLTIVTVPPMAWRWQRLLAARDLHESVAWLTRTYFISYAGARSCRRRSAAMRPDLRDGAASSRAHHTDHGLRPAGACDRRRGHAAARGGRVPARNRPLLDRRVPVAGGDLRRRDDRSRDRLLLAQRAQAASFALPLARKLRLETPARAVYDGIHGYREHPGTLLLVAAVTVLLQLSRIFAIYASGRAVGIHLSVLPYIVLGPLLFLVMLVPFTVNGIGVREAFFVSFMGNLDVPADRAFACGFLFFVMTIMLAAPGLAFILWEQVFDRRAPVPERSG